jgi:DNA-binding response OmpR family regulator
LPLLPFCPPWTVNASTVLVIEDDPGLRLLLYKSLQIARCSVIAVHNTAAILGYFAQFTIDVVVLDLDMSLSIGFDLCEAIHRRSAAGIIVTSLWNTYEIKAKATYCGAHSFLPKPIRLADLHCAVQGVTSKSALKHC